MWFEKLHRHGPLPSRHLYRFSRFFHKSDQKAQERLEHLTRRTKTPHRGRYLSRPEEQRATDRALSNYMVHDITDKAKLALKDAGRFHTYTPVHATGRQWMHDFMLSCFTASIELATLEDPRFAFIFHDEICTALGDTLSFNLEYKDEKGWQQKRLLKPDRAFGIKYPNGTIRRFLIEADRGTEQNKVSEGRKSGIDNLLQYTEFIGEGRYREAMNVKGGVMLIYLMTSPGKLENIKSHLNEMTGGCNYVIFKAVDGFGHVIKPPLPMPELFTTPFERAGKDSFYLNQ